MSKLVEQSVLDFTVQSGYDVTKYYPDPVERRTLLIEQNTRMIGSELNELLQSVMPFEEAKAMLHKIADEVSDSFPSEKSEDTEEKKEEHVESYKNRGKLSSLNQVIVDLFPDLNVIFEDSFLSIHQNNMAKKWEDGTFHLRESDGKVLKPPNHKEPTLVINKLYLESDFAPLTKDQVVDFVRDVVERLYANILDSAKFLTLFETDIHDCNMDHTDPDEILKNQVDAFIDILYYNTNTMVKLGIVY